MSSIICTLDSHALAAYTCRQLDVFFPDAHRCDAEELEPVIQVVLQRLEVCFAPVYDNRYRTSDGKPFFNHLHTDQYATFLYFLANQCWKEKLNLAWAEKLYALNKVLHGVDIYYQVALPDIFFLGHPVGAVLGRAKYGSHLVVLQNVTVGSSGDRERPGYSTIGDGVVLSAGATLIGACEVGNDCCVGACTLLVDARIPKECTVTGRPGALTIRPSRFARWKTYFLTGPSN